MHLNIKKKQNLWPQNRANVYFFICKTFQAQTFNHLKKKLTSLLFKRLLYWVSQTASLVYIDFCSFIRLVPFDIINLALFLWAKHDVNG